jgi:AcrR family transcriptional regulator
MAAPETAKRSEPRDRLLRTATGLFYGKGIHAVGIEEIVSEANVTRATLYRHFDGKEGLVVAYLEAAAAATVDQVDAAIDEGAAPEEVVRAIGESIVAQILSPYFRGCAFLNAAVEFPDPDSAVHRVVLAHRAWLLETVASWLGRLGDGPAEPVAQHFVMLRDGAMMAACLTDPEATAEVFRAGVEGIIRSRHARADDVS